MVDKVIQSPPVPDVKPADETGAKIKDESVQPSASRLAARDLIEGCLMWRLWGTLGLQDIRQRYRRSILGPFWLTLSLAILVCTLGLLYGQLMGKSYREYVPHLTLGFISWQLINGLVSDGCKVFISAEAWIKSVRSPLSLFVWQLTWRHLVIAAHNMLVYVGVALLLGIWCGLEGLLVVPGLLLVLANAVWVMLLVGILCARFRDIPPIVSSLMRLAFFVTPILWMPDQLGTRSHLALFNPFTYFVEVLRGPLLGYVPSAATWMLALAVTIVGWSVTWPMFVRFRGRVPYWL
ncbi:ABC transporter permease [Rhodospirillaceae bacterium SYSU D60014]|uniref:ABC transporter permease n=1 Tax=Virgifigura deserti TaxID=2268457 RepID=UPI000E67559B